MLNSIKTQASVLAKLFHSHGVELSRAQSMEYMAQMYGLADSNELATRKKELDKSVQSFLCKSFRSEDQLRMNGTAVEVAIGLTLSKNDSSLEELSAEIAKAAYNWKASKGEILKDFEISHAALSSGNKNGYDDECVIRTVSGFSLATSAFPDEIDYLRVINPKGEELMHWSIDEVQEDPSNVLGAILGALRPNGAKEGENQETAEPTGYKGFDFSFEEAPAGDGKFNGGYVDFRIYRNVDEPGSGVGADVRLHVYIDCEESRVVLGDVAYAPSREDDYESTPVPKSVIETLLLEIKAQGVVNDTAQSMLAALQKQQPLYTGWVFTAADLHNALEHGLNRLLAK